MTLVEFPSFRRAQGALPFFIGMLSLFLVVLYPLLPDALLRIFASLLLAALFFQSLFGGGYSAFHAGAITSLSFAQAGLFVSTTGGAGSIWLALASFCIAMTAADFVRHHDARRVMALGAALSFAQGLDPLGGLLALFLLPLCVGLPRSGETRDKAGLFALLLFMPMVTAIVLAYTRQNLGADLSLHPNTSPSAAMPLTLLLCLCFASAPTLWLTTLVPRLKHPAGLITVYTALALLLAVTLKVLTGTPPDFASLLGAGAAISVAALCSWKPSARNQSLALAAVTLATLVSWLLFNLPFAVI